VSPRSTMPSRRSAPGPRCASVRAVEEAARSQLARPYAAPALKAANSAHASSTREPRDEGVRPRTRGRGWEVRRWRRFPTPVIKRLITKHGEGLRFSAFGPRQGRRRHGGVRWRASRARPTPPPPPTSADDHRRRHRLGPLQDHLDPGRDASKEKARNSRSGPPFRGGTVRRRGRAPSAILPWLHHPRHGRRAAGIGSSFFASPHDALV